MARQQEDARVVVTGLGATTPLGGDVASTWSALLAGKSGIRRLAGDWPADLPVRIGGLTAVDPASVVTRTELRTMDRSTHLALIAAREAWRDAGAPEVAPDRLGVSAGTALGGYDSLLAGWGLLTTKSWRAMSPYTAPRVMPNSAADWIGIEIGARAGSHTSVGACASGAEAIAYGVEMIRSGRADVVLAGGTETPVTPVWGGMFSKMQALSSCDDPESASRPFDRSRDGFVLAEGAGMIVLESAEHAARRGASGYAVAAGIGYSSDAYHIAVPQPDGSGLAAAMRRALEDARLAPEQVVHVNAHATATRAGDVAEAAAIRSALGDAARGALVTATKSMTGHMVGAAGAVEAVAAICALRASLAPPTVNLGEPDADVVAFGLDIATDARELRGGPGIRAALTNSSGFGGHNVALAFTTE
ncbi:beta-ketoacyl-[acyl-carrier-protein] synthase family protein [Streptomyces sp. NPDC001076]